MADYRVIVLPRAFADLDAIIDYVAKDSPQNASALLERLWAAMHSLDALPSLQGASTQG
jgi:plasmid stabilization system protein ParE